MIFGLFAGRLDDRRLLNQGRHGGAVYSAGASQRSMTPARRQLSSS
jgi:hypothetical protein